MSPLAEYCRVPQEISNVGFVITLEAHQSMLMAPANQEIQHLSGLWPAVDVITQQYLDDPGRWMRRNVGVNACKALCQKIRATVHVSDRVNANTIGRPWNQFSGSRQQRIPPQISGTLRSGGLNTVTYIIRIFNLSIGFSLLLPTEWKVICGVRWRGDAGPSAAPLRPFARSCGWYVVQKPNR